MAKKKPVITLLGKSGCGKDTQGDILVNAHGFSMINSGAILRGLKDPKILSHFKKNSIEYYEIQEIQKIINAGKFIPTLPMTCQWRIPVLELVRNPKNVKGIVFTGSPRKLAEALIIHEFFQNWPDAERNFQLFPILINLSGKEAFKRLSKRRQCNKCKKIFSASAEHLALKVCDQCGGKLVKRKDDSTDGIKSRMGEFQKYVVPVLKYFRSEKLLHSVDGEQSIEQVHKDITKLIGL